MRPLLVGVRAGARIGLTFWSLFPAVEMPLPASLSRAVQRPERLPLRGTHTTAAGFPCKLWRSWHSSLTVIFTDSICNDVENVKTLEL